ncbi:MAG: hypothetical protein ACOYIK_04515 [Coriobacteriales bacterium]|jgi:membrane protein YdbS with pleckstrin-like domain
MRELPKNKLNSKIKTAWRNISFVKFQDAGTMQDLLLCVRNLEGASLSTAMGFHKVSGLPSKEADELGNSMVALAMLAREDV